MANYCQDFGTVGGLAILFLPSTMATCSDYITLLPSNNTSLTIDSKLSLQSAIIILICFGTFVIVLSYLFNVIRKFVYQDKTMLDFSFDAGGRVSVGLTATTIVSQWTWAATLLQSSTVAANNGISGPFWYAAGATIPLLMFAALSVQMKIRAPGAKTFLQVIQARFGNRTHLVFCAFAIMTNIIVTAMLMMGGCAVLTSLVDGLSLEMAAMCLTVIIWASTGIGGLGATFYLSYFNTTIIFIIMTIFVLITYNNLGSRDTVLGTIGTVYDLLNCTVGPERNQDRSYLTFVSPSGIMFGVINIVGNFGTVFVDQSYWQSSVAAKPREGMWGFLIGGLVWFAIPFTFASTMGLAYLALSADAGMHLLTPDQIAQGLVPPRIAQELMGWSGELLIVILILLAVTTTGSAEVMAITSILVYDCYQIHLKPFRRVADSNGCILCGKSRGRMASLRDQCGCQSMTDCKWCHADDRARIEQTNRALKPSFKCTVHGTYRTYLELLQGKRNWSLVWVSLSFVPLTIIFNYLQVNLNAVYNFMGILIGSSVTPIILSMFWTRLTGMAMMMGATIGMVCGLITWVIAGSILNGQLNFSVFFDSSWESFDANMLIGNCGSILTGALITVVVSLLTNRGVTEEEKHEIWEKTRDIDNPLSPWPHHYVKEFGVPEGKLVYNRPSLLQMLSEFRRANLIAIISGLSFTFILAVLWPVIMSTMGVLNKSEFRSWIYLCETWAILGGAFIIFVPIVTEIREIAMRLKENKDRMMVGPEEERNPPARRVGQPLPQGPNVRRVPTISGDTALS
ncbi:urea-proton symporter DUR3 [Strongylocentrotus purpuratus]|uniref:Uncharacterized protein n=1 Tax=Strongylocentrotus purpuratus TaxID=7668 RepID=A0A7M7N022_STRPU|nr:urea-proton symporter DUR3 [Strongylocentrotus purpuratus]